MITNKFHEHVYNERDLVNLVMSGHDILRMNNVIIDQQLDLDRWPDTLIRPGWHCAADDQTSVQEFHAANQKNWMMPQAYYDLDIAAYLLDLCSDQAQLQRVGDELLLFQERGLFNLLRYLKFLVDVMEKNQIIWGVGRGSSVSSYVLYLLGVHRIDSMYYDLDPREFLR